jgi:hypothetical protein
VTCSQPIADADGEGSTELVTEETGANIRVVAIYRV